MTVAPVSTKRRVRIMHCHAKGDQPCKNAPVVCCVADDAPGLGFLCETHRHEGACCAFRIARAD